jgi:tetratricopeptide (TPR) repeat protein
MTKSIFSMLCATLLLAGHAAVAKPVEARVTVGSKTSNGYFISRNQDLITFRIIGMGGDVSYPADAIKQVEFPVKVDEAAVGNMIQNRMHEQLAATLESAMQPFLEYSDLPSNLARYQGVLMELYYKVENYDKCMSYASKLMKDERDPELQRKATIYQGLALLGAGRLEEAEALFDAQGWSGEMNEDAAAEDLYTTAKFLFMKQDYNRAIETAAKIIAFHSQDPDWMRPAELLCAEIYMGMAQAQKNPVFLDSADEVIREISLLYRDTDEADEVQNLKLRVDALRMEVGDGDENTDVSGR